MTMTTRPQPAPQIGPAEAAKRLGVSRRHFHRIAKGRPIPGARLVRTANGTTWLYPVESIDTLALRSPRQNAIVRRIVRAALDVELGFGDGEEGLREELLRSRYVNGARVHALALARVRDVLATLATKRVIGP